MPRRTISFSKFVRNWRKERLDNTAGIDFEMFCEVRAAELMQLAIRNGYVSDLTEALRPYRNVAEYVRALHDAEVYRSSVDSNEPGEKE